MDIIKKIDDLMNERGWTDYRLASESGLSSSTIANIHRRNTIPSIPTLDAICNAFGITLSQFFAEESTTVQLNREQSEFFRKWSKLSQKQKAILNNLVDEMK